MFVPYVQNSERLSETLASVIQCGYNRITAPKTVLASSFHPTAKVVDVITQDSTFITARLPLHPRHNVYRHRRDHRQYVSNHRTTFLAAALTPSQLSRASSNMTKHPAAAAAPA